jgi:enoyl-CoA hydratase/carnithine racemase
MASLTALSDLELLGVDLSDGVLTLELRRPDKLNAIDTKMFDELISALKVIETSRMYSVLVLRGAGRAFSSGVDLRGPISVFDDEMRPVAAARGITTDGHAKDYGRLHLIEWWHEAVSLLYGLRQPTIAAINGDAIGGAGLGLAMACDLRYSVTNARFRLIPTLAGVAQDFGVTWTLQRAIGLPRVMEMIFSGEWVDADRAYTWGLVNRTYPTVEEMNIAIDRLCRTIVSCPQEVLAVLKHIVRSGAENTLASQLQLEALSNGLIQETDQARATEAKFRSHVGVRRPGDVVSHPGDGAPSGAQP